eukprot:4112353-Prymnesium_polylepis.1
MCHRLQAQAAGPGRAPAPARARPAPARRAFRAACLLARRPPLAPGPRRRPSSRGRSPSSQKREGDGIRRAGQRAAAPI